MSKVGPHVPRGPDVVAGDQVAARARPLGAGKKEPPPLLGIALDRRHGDLPDAGLGAAVVVRVGPKLAEVLGGPPLVADLDLPTVGQGLDLPLGLGRRARDPGSRGKSGRVRLVGLSARGTQERHKEDTAGKDRAWSQHEYGLPKRI